jgi:hypothetical protein
MVSQVKKLINIKIIIHIESIINMSMMKIKQSSCDRTSIVMDFIVVNEF